MLYHIMDEPTLLEIAGVPEKFSMKLIFAVLPAVLLFCRQWMAWVVFLFLFVPPQAFARGTDCQHARELLDQSGVARDADENLFGKVKVQPPRGSFPSDMDQITWWGVFRPFEFWESPKFEAVWINPQGQEAARHSFRGNKCRLAKDSIRAESQPRGEYPGGMWSVIVTCDDYLIDKQTFAVLPAGGNARPTGPDSPGHPSETAMIWAKDAVDE